MRQIAGTIAGLAFLLAAWPLFAEDAPDGETVCYSRGVHLFFDGRSAEASNEFAAASAAAPDNPVYYYFIGLCFSRQGDEESALAMFQLGAEAELTAKGQLVDVGEHLRRIQGDERLKIEEVRQETLKLWREKEARRQEALYGETLSRQKEYLSQSKITVVGLNSESQSAETVSADNLPLVPPIMPLSRTEISSRESEELAASQKDELFYLKDEVGKVALSSSAQRRRQLREKQLLYKDPENRPAADGSKFVDIYAADQVAADGEAFFDPNEPKEEAPAEEKPVGGLTPLTPFLEKIQAFGGAEEPDMEGPDVMEATAEMFGAETPANPFADKPLEAAPADGMNLFEADRKFTPKK